MANDLVAEDPNPYARQSSTQTQKSLVLRSSGGERPRRKEGYERTDLQPFSPEWWAERREYQRRTFPRGLDEQSQAAFDLSAYNADTSQHGYTEAVAAYLKTDSKPDHSIASMSASHWFLHQSMRLRFVGMTREQCLEMREALIEVAAQHANSPTRVLAAALSKEAERHYPQEFATEWVKEHPTARRPAA